MKLRNLTLTAAACALTLAVISAPLIAQPRRGGDAERSWVAGERPERPGRPEGAEHPGRPGGPDRPENKKAPGEIMERLMRPFWNNENLATELALTEEQIVALEESHTVAREALEGSKGTVKDAMKALKTELEKDSPELNAVYALQDTITAELDSKAKIVLGHAVTTKNILTADQEALLKELGKKAMKRPGRPGGPDGPDGAIREEIHSILQDGGTIDDVRAYLETTELPDTLVERIITRVEENIDAIAAGEAPAARPNKERPGRPEARGERRGQQ